MTLIVMDLSWSRPEREEGERDHTNTKEECALNLPGTIQVIPSGSSIQQAGGRGSSPSSVLSVRLQ